MLAKDNFTVYTFAIERADSLSKFDNIVMCSTLEETVEKSDIVVGPIPLSSNRKNINTPFSEEIISLEKLFSVLDNRKFIAGGIYDDIYKLTEDKSIEIIDLMQREELAVLNTISTAEGAIQIAMEETLATLHGANVLILGFGRIGKILSKMLSGIGSNVYCEARRNSDIAWIKAYGYNSVHINELESSLNKFNIIINTIPCLILDDKKLEKVNQDCLIIDLASNPGGVDRNAAKAKGIKTVWALSLPGKVAPLTSAEFIKETIYNILKEM